MKNVLITGGSRGIGEAISRLFAKNGYNVIINYNSSFSQAEKLKSELNCDIVKADISKEIEVKAMIDYIKNKYGKLDILINNSGRALPQKTLLDCSLDEFNYVFDTNCKGTFLVTKYALPLMLNCGKAIINISSIWGVEGGSCETIYSASKGAINSFTLALSQELEQTTIKVVSIAPDYVETQMNSHLSTEDKMLYKESFGIEKFTTTEDVANLVLKTVSSEEIKNGQILLMNGGKFNTV